MKINYLLGIFLFLLTSCEKEDNGLKYYRFQKSDEQWFTNYKKGDTITFISDSAPLRIYIVAEVNDNRKSDWHEGFYSSPEFYYDSRELELYRIDNFRSNKSSGRYVIHMYRFPIPYSTGKLNLTSNESRFVVSGYFDDYNGIDSASTLIFHDSLQPTQYYSLTIKGKVYKELVLNQSFNPNSYCRNCPIANPADEWSLRVHQIYYHRQFGVIQFSDIDGATWQIKR